jgi:hypothetical protein
MGIRGSGDRSATTPFCRSGIMSICRNDASEEFVVPLLQVLICCRPASAADPPLLVTRRCCPTNSCCWPRRGRRVPRVYAGAGAGAGAGAVPSMSRADPASRMSRADPASRMSRADPASRPPERIRPPGLPSDPASRAIRPPIVLLKLSYN